MQIYDFIKSIFRPDILASGASGSLPRAADRFRVRARRAIRRRTLQGQSGAVRPSTRLS